MDSKVVSPVPNGEPTPPKGKTGVTNTVDTSNEDSTVVKNGDGDVSDSKDNGESSQSCSCNCSCQIRLEKLENEMNDLKNWKAGRKEFEDVLTNWKDEVNKWMQSTFGFIISSTLTSRSEDVDMTQASRCENKTKDLNSEDVAVAGLPGGESSNIHFNPEETENVEITPDLFGHFLLDNEYSHDDDLDDDIQEIDDSLDDEGSESEVPNEKTPEQPRPKRRRRNNDDSDSECFTLSSSSSDLESSDEDEYEPQPKRGRGRGRGRGMMRPTHRTSPNKIRPDVGNSSASKISEDLGNVESRKELLKHCRKRQGNIWECTVCGLMLTSFDNMLLHIKYNHSSSTHTCPHCRIVVLCRSPKDAVLHQAQCKMRPDPNSNNKPPETKIIRPTLPAPVVAVVPSKPKGISEINAEVDKLVADMLEPGGSTTKSASSTKKNNKKTESPDIVTLSSDED